MEGVVEWNGPTVLEPLRQALSRAVTVEQVANALVDFGLPAVGGCVAVLVLRSDDGKEFSCPWAVGYPREIADAWKRFPVDAPVPLAEAVRENRPVLLRTLEERVAYYPPDYPLPPTRVGRALAAVPMRRGQVVGGLGFTFPDDRAFDEAERAVLTAMAELCGEALNRVRRGGLGIEVLLAEDEPALVAMLDFALKYRGFAVRRASSGEEAVRLYQQHHHTVDIALLDVQMPGLDGPHTLAALRQIDPTLPCVFMSGNTGEYTGELLLALGAAAVLSKPFTSVDAVVQALRAAARRPAAT